jgi:hypothetical protein
LTNAIIKCLTAFDWNVNELKKFSEANKQAATVFDLDRNDPMYEKKMIRVLLSQPRRLHNNASFFEPLREHPMLKELLKAHEKFFYELAMKFLEVSFTATRVAFFSEYVNIEGCDEETHWKNSVAADECSDDLKLEIVGQTVHPFNDMLRHTCVQNTDCLFVSNKLVTIVSQPIKRGNEIFKNLFRSFPRCDSASRLKRNYSPIVISTCDCEACVNYSPASSRKRSVDPMFQYPEVKVFAPHDQAKKNIARNNAYVDSNYKEHKPTQEVCVTIYNNYTELCGLARASFYP